MEDLQYRILDFSKYCSLHCHVKWKERRKERKDSDGRGNSTEQEETEKQKSNGNPDWQDGGNMTDVDMLQLPCTLLFSNYCTCNGLL